MMNSFRNRLVVTLVILLMCVQLATAVFVLNAARAEKVEQQQKNLDVGINVFREVLANRSQQLSHSLSILSADFGFKRAIATGESETILSALENHGNRIGANAVVLLSPEGKLISSSLRDIGDKGIKALFELTKEENKTGPAEILAFNNTGYQFVMQPVKAPTLIAWVGMGFVLDRAVAQQAKSITGVDISFVSRNNAGRYTLQSTLSEADQADILPHMKRLPELAAQAAEGFPDHYLSYAVKLNEQATDQWALLHLSNLQWEKNFLQLRNTLLSIFAITLGLSLLATMWLSGSLVRPVHALVEFSRQIGQGKSPPPLKGAPAELQVLADTMSVMRDNIEAREQDLLYQSSHDSLTGLNNRFAAKRYLSEGGQELTGKLVLMDLKNFRHINDTIGFVNADLLLVLFARRLEQLQPEPDFLARLDGDSFLLLYREGLTEEKIHLALDQLEEPYVIRHSQITVKIRAGILSLSDHGGSVGALLRRVEIALMQACQEDSRIVDYRAGEDEKYQRELSIISDLSRGLEQGQCYLVFQPKVDIQRGICIGAEALIRWEHPEMGPIRPDEFILLAESTGNIALVSQWVLRRAVAQLVDWRQRGMDIKLAVNLSAHDLVNEHLPGEIVAMLRDAELPTRMLAIEVTEGSVMKDPLTVVGVLKEFRDLGISVAIDDFGTGHSSLAYLKMLPVNEVKIDRSFVKDILTNHHDAMIVETSIALTHSLGFSVTAEGVEDEPTVSMLKRQGCDVVQGYVYSRPLKAREFIQWYQQFTQPPRE